MSQAVISPVPSVRLAPATGAWARARSGVSALLATAAREWRVRRDLRALEDLDARALADLGIGHGQAEGAVRFGRSALRGRPGDGPIGREGPLMPPSWTEWR